MITHNHLLNFTLIVIFSEKDKKSILLLTIICKTTQDVTITTIVVVIYAYFHFNNNSYIGHIIYHTCLPLNVRLLSINYCTRAYTFNSMHMRD